MLFSSQLRERKLTLADWSRCWRVVLAFGFLLVAPVGHAVDLLPDLVPVADESKNYMYGGEFDLTDEPGRVLYRFDGVIANFGDGPLELFETTDPEGPTQDIYQNVYNTEGGFTQHYLVTFENYTPGPFGHLHYERIARYNLREVLPDNGIGDVVATQDKTSHAVVDSVKVNGSLPNSPPSAQYTSVNDNPLGVSIGYADLYRRTIPAQRIDVTGLASGEYWLEVIIDPDGNFIESDTTNNIERILVDLDIPHPVTIDGDYNADGTVDAGDYVVWRNNLGAPAGTLANDPHATAIGTDQYATWKTNFGDTLSASLVASNVPEPTSTMILIAGSTCIVGLSWKQRLRSHIENQPDLSNPI